MDKSAKSEGQKKEDHDLPIPNSQWLKRWAEVIVHKDV
jgi:hypothetical protein